MTTLPLVDPAARDLVQGFAALDPTIQTLPEYRAAIHAAFSGGPPTGALAPEIVSVPGPQGAPDVRLLLHRPEAATGPVPAILFLHPSGFVAGAAVLSADANAALAQSSGALVVAVSYRLAPETPFPGALEDAYAALVWLAAYAETLGVDPDRIAVMGESAGGGLAAALALLARRRGGPRLAAQILVYPMLDPRTGTPDAPVANPTTGEFVWTMGHNGFGWSALRGEQAIAPEDLELFGPALAESLADLPPTFIAVGALDLFLEEDVAYALRLSRSGVPTELHVYPGGVHGFDVVPGPLGDQYRTALSGALARWLK